MARTDSIFTSSAVFLFGKVLEDLIVQKAIEDEEERPRRVGRNKFLQRQAETPNAKLARIYAFAYEGTYYDLARPIVYLVHGDGQDPDFPQPNGPGIDRLGRSPSDPDRLGVGFQIGSFASSMRVWVYDKSDLSMRLEVDTGTFEQILLGFELRGRDLRGLSGSALARSSGALARSSGVIARRSYGDEID